VHPATARHFVQIPSPGGQSQEARWNGSGMEFVVMQGEGVIPFRRKGRASAKSVNEPPKNVDRENGAKGEG